MRKLFSLFMVLLASVSMLHASDIYVNGIYYDFNIFTLTATVTYRGDYSSHYDEYSGEVIIPENVTYNGITYSVTSIGNYAFSVCYSLTSVTIPNSVTSIGSYAFNGCSRLLSVTIPNSVTNIGEYTFYGCSSLTSATIPNSVTSIGGWAFCDCRSLTSITIPNSVTSIGNLAFYNCSSLTSPLYNAHCFAYMPTSYSGAYTIPEGIEQIAGGAFAYCSSLTSITIPNSVTSIGDWAFKDCSSLTSVTIGNSVTSIGDKAFEDCSKLTLVTINSDAIVSKDYSYNSNISHIFGSQVTEYIIGDDAKGIGSYAFYNCFSLTSVTILNSVTSIGESAFSNCSSLTSVTIPNSVTSIGSYAFYNCSKLTKTNYTGDIAGWCNIKFGGVYANPIYHSHNFYINDQEIKDLVIPNSITSIGSCAFYGCSSLTSITIPNSVTSIGDGAFAGCSGLISITIPKSVTNIGANAFYGCSYLTSITCEAETPPVIDYSTFADVPTSIPIYVPCGCVGVYGAASGWNSFTNIQEPVAEYSINVTTSGGGEVDVYNSICGNSISAHPSHGYHFVQWSDGNTDNPRTLELTKDTILTAEFAQSYSGKCGDNLYWSYNENEQSITITGSGNMYNYSFEAQPWALFRADIKIVTTDNTVKSIGSSAFEGAIRLAEVHLGTSIEAIHVNAFARCDRLRNIYCYPTYPPIINEYSFERYDANLYIPCDYIEDYMFDYYWKKFENVQCAGAEKEEMGSNGVEVAPSSTSVTITWPTEGNADTYTIVIKKDGEVVCTLTFNSEGQLLNIAFAPGREGNHPAQYAEAVANGGYRFTVTGLTESTDYTYDITVKDASNKTIKSHSGKFTTESLTAVENTHSQSPMTNCQKILRDGQLLILRDGVEYNAMGQEL